MFDKITLLINNPYNSLIGFFLVFFGGYVVSSGHFSLKKHNTPEKFKKSTCVVINGFYKYSRNPMYLGLIIILSGISFVLNSLLSLVPVIIFFLYY